jgi:AcrR family transcriptional regulator
VPRKADPQLEKTIISAAVRLLERGGLEAITMREVAKMAATTTPTIYERFTDRDALLEAVTNVYRDELSARLDSRDSLEQMGRKFLQFCLEKPNAIDLLIDRMAANLEAAKKGPVYDLVRTNLVKLNGFPPKTADEITLATTSTMAGTAILINRVGRGSRAANELQDATLKLLRRVANSNNKRDH